MMVEEKHFFFEKYADKPNGDGGWDVLFNEIAHGESPKAIVIDFRSIPALLQDPYCLRERRVALSFAINACPVDLQEEMGRHKGSVIPFDLLHS